MQTGAIISGTAHGALIIVTLLGGFDWWKDTLPEPRITKVTLVRAAELDVQSSSAPVVPMSDMAQITQPEITNDSIDAPSADVAPVATVMDETETPDSADLEPDLSALIIPEQPDVVAVAPTVENFALASEAAPDIFRPALNGNELNAPVSMSAPPPPRNAPRIDTSAAAKPPEDSRPSIDATPEVSEGLGERVDEEVQEASAPEEASTEITPEGQRDVEISAFAPQTASRPPRRPRRLNVPTPAPEEDISDAVNAALQAAQQATQEEPPVVAELTGAETATIGDAIRAQWNSITFQGLPNIEDYVVYVIAVVGPTGRIEEVLPSEPTNPTGIHKNIYDSARRALLIIGELPLPDGKFPDGARLRLRFNPASGDIGLN